MKKHLYIYGAMVMLFIAYNQFFRIEDQRLNSGINILFASFLFLYIGFMAYVALKKIKNTSRK